ncbi:MAG: hypothetical protein K6G65_02850 [Lachnospiraceae bacterium]|nr:hypothetical protein [Lachnospiraceae bacterium]
MIKYTINHFEFASKEDFEKARKEADAIEYMKSKTDLTKPEVAYKVYMNIVDKRSFRTIVGYHFLQQLRDWILENNPEYKPELPDVPVWRLEQVVQKTPETAEQIHTENALAYYKEKYHSLKSTRTILIIIVCFLTVTVASMMAITYFTPNSIFTNYREKIENEYEGWSEELEQRESAIEEKEAELGIENDD